MLLIRPWVCRKYLPRQSKMSVYAAMYYIPVLVVTHALIGGLLCKYRLSLLLFSVQFLIMNESQYRLNINVFIADYAFPILVIILSVISCAYHFAIKINQSITSLIITTVVEPRNIIIVVGHWCFHAYGIISITQLTNPMVHSLLLLLVPLPALFYIFTAKFTDPSIIIT